MVDEASTHLCLSLLSSLQHPLPFLCSFAASAPPLILVLTTLPSSLALSLQEPQVHFVPQLRPLSHRQDWKVSMRKTVFGESGRTALGSQLLGESRPTMRMQWMFEEQMRLPSGLSTRTSLVQGMYRIVGRGLEMLSRLTVLAKAEPDRGKETPQYFARDHYPCSCVLVKHMEFSVQAC